jgi:hypothetical protein
MDIDTGQISYASLLFVSEDQEMYCFNETAIAAASKDQRICSFSRERTKLCLYSINSRIALAFKIQPLRSWPHIPGADRCWRLLIINFYQQRIATIVFTAAKVGWRS